MPPGATSVDAVDACATTNAWRKRVPGSAAGQGGAYVREVDEPRRRYRREQLRPCDRLRRRPRRRGSRRCRGGRRGTSPRRHADRKGAADDPPLARAKGQALVGTRLEAASASVGISAGVEHSSGHPRGRYTGTSLQQRKLLHEDRDPRAGRDLRHRPRIPHTPWSSSTSRSTTTASPGHGEAAPIGRDGEDAASASAWLTEAASLLPDHLWALH